MTQAPVTKLVVTLGIPTTLSMLVTNIYNMVDTMFVGKLGNSASGAVGIVFGFMAILQAFGFMFGQGAGSMISRKLGSRETEDATKIASTSFFSAFSAGLIIEILGLIFMEPMIYLLGSTDTILPYAKQYVFFILLAAPFMASGCVLNNILRYEGKASMAMIGLMSGAVLNMAGDPLFMFVLGLGVKGAGLSTALSQFVSFSILLYMFISGKTQSKISVKRITKDVKDVLEIVETGFPSLVRQGLSSISTMVLNGQAALYGDEAVAAMSIVSRICMFIFSVGLGIGQGFQPVSGFNYGAGKYSRVKKAFFSTFLISECLIGTFALIGICFSGHAIGIFRNDEQVIAIGTQALRYQCIGLLFQPLCLMANMTLQSTGYKAGATFLSMLRSGLYFIPMVLLLSYVWGLRGIESAQTFADMLSFATAVPFMILFFKRLPKDNS
jgi:putative MATE family efflux protein